MDAPGRSLSLPLSFSYHSLHLSSLRSLRVGNGVITENDMTDKKRGGADRDEKRQRKRQMKDNIRLYPLLMLLPRSRFLGSLTRSSFTPSVHRVAVP